MNKEVTYWVILLTYLKEIKNYITWDVNMIQNGKLLNIYFKVLDLF